MAGLDKGHQHLGQIKVVIDNQNIVIWYVPQMSADPNPGSYYCWTVTGDPNPETYPCFSGPMFHPYSEALEMGAASFVLQGRVKTDNTTQAGAIVVVRDVDGNRVPLADVTPEWILPDGSTDTQVVATRPNGRAIFQASNPEQGTYTFTIQDIVHDGHYFDPSLGQTTQSLDVP